MKADHKAAKEWAETKLNTGDNPAAYNLATAYLELRELAQAYFDHEDSRHDDCKICGALRSALEEKP